MKTAIFNFLSFIFEIIYVHKNQFDEKKRYFIEKEKKLSKYRRADLFI